MPETPDWNAPLPQPAIQTVAVTTDANEAIVTVLSIVGVAGRSIVVVGCSLVPARIDTANEAVRAYVQLIVSDNLVTYLCSATIGPFSPMAAPTFPPGTLVAAVGNGVAGQLLTEPGGGRIAVNAAILYYLQ